MRIEIRSDVIRGAHDDFPWWIEIRDPEIAAHAELDARDITFVDASGRRLNADIESVGPDGLLAWVQLDVSASKDSAIYLYFDSAVAPPINTASQVWDGYAAVYHMDATEAAQGLTDMTGNGHRATLSQPAITGAGPLGLALEFDLSQVATVASKAFLEIENTLQVSAWASARSWAENEGTILSKAREHGSQSFDYLLRASDSWATIGIYDGSSTTGTYANSIAWGQEDQWRYLVGRYDGEELTLFLDAEPNERSPVATSIRASDRPLVIGDFGPTQPDTTRRWDGYLDEIRVSSVIRSDEWIQTEFANQSLGPDAISVGPVELRP